MEAVGMNERMSDENVEIFLNQEFFISKYIDDENYYVEVKYRKVEQWAFYLRFISGWYHPCFKCQKRLKELVLNAQLRVSVESARVDFAQIVKANKIEYRFVLPFISALPWYEFKPCPECQKGIADLIKNATVLTIGNKDYEHPVELSRKNEDDDKSFQCVVKHKATNEEKERVGTRWIKKQLSKEEYDKLVAIEE